MIRCPHCLYDEFTILHDGGIEVLCQCYKCDAVFEHERDYPPYYIEDGMEIKTISYKRIKNLGNYESEALEMSAELDYEEDPIAFFHDLKHQVEVALGLRQPEPVNTEREEKPANTDEDDLDNTPF